VADDRSTQHDDIAMTYDIVQASANTCHSTHLLNNNNMPLQSTFLPSPPAY